MNKILDRALKTLTVFRIAAMAVGLLAVETFVGCLFALCCALMLPFVLIFLAFGLLFVIPWHFLYTLWMYVVTLDKSVWRDFFDVVFFFCPILSMDKNEKMMFMEILRYMKETWRSVSGSIAEVCRSLRR